MAHYFYKNDLPSNIDLGSEVAVDTETMGLSLLRDRLCLVQLSAGNGDAHLVQIDQQQKTALNLQAVMENPKVLKIFHYARFDVGMLKENLGINCGPIFCTKIASKLVRTYTDKHGLKDLCRELLGVDISKQQQSSDWGSSTITEDQMIYAANDVLHLHQLMRKLKEMLVREGRLEMAESCFEFLPTRAHLDLFGWENDDIFRH